MKQILRMNCAVRCPQFDLLECLAAVIADLLIYDFNLAAGVQNCNHSGDAVHNQTGLLLAFTQSVLGSLLVVNIRQQDTPPNDITVRITNGVASVLEPSISAVGSFKTLDDLV